MKPQILAIEPKTIVSFQLSEFQSGISLTVTLFTCSMNSSSVNIHVVSAKPWLIQQFKQIPMHGMKNINIMVVNPRQMFFSRPKKSAVSSNSDRQDAKDCKCEFAGDARSIFASGCSWQLNVFQHNYVSESSVWTSHYAIASRLDRCEHRTFPVPRYPWIK